MKCKKAKLIAVLSAVALVVAIITVSVMAYFSTLVYVYTNEDGNKEIFHSGMNLSLLFGELNDSVNDTTINLPNYTYAEGTNPYVIYNETVVIDTDAPLGSAKNPYVIETTKHLYNLSALQNAGYFDAMYLSKNFNADGTYKTGSVEIPYFLICTPQGAPVTVGGTDGKAIEIKPIGSLEHPFVGVIGGAFVEGTTTVGGTMNADGTITGGKTSSVSTIHNVKVQTTTNQTDVGLFGYIGYLGVEPKPEDVVTNPTFAGAVSSIQNLLLSDVQIIVDEPNILEIVSDLFIKVWEDYFGDGKYHRYTYTNMTAEAGKTLPKETHHIGIFAGHVSYATIDKINVYYSEENVMAINLKGVNASDNYYTASGILGMFYNMNCKVFNSYEEETNGTDITYVVNGNCTIQIGTGTSSDEVEQIVGGSGSGTGGGIYSGNGRGYVTAAEIFTKFNNVDIQNENQELLWRYKVAGVDWVEEAILILEKKGANNSVTYTLADGKTEVTITTDRKSVSTTGANPKTWYSFFIREIITDQDGQAFNYKTPLGDPVSECEMVGNKYNGQIIWKYSAGGDGIWHYGIRVIKASDGKYYLEDETTKVEFKNGQIEAENGTVWKNFFISDKTETNITTHYMFDPSTGEKWAVSNFERKPLPLIKAYGENQKTQNDELLCVPWQANGQTSVLYYFYDGVFTFGLSSPDDTVRDTWKNDVTPRLYLGPDNPEGWTVNEKRGNKSLVALLKPVTTNQQLNAAISANKQFYISAQPITGEAHFMSLITGEGQSDTSKPYPIGSSHVFLGDADLRESLLTSYKSGMYTKLPTVPLTGQTEDGKMLKADGTPVTLEDLQDPAFWGDGSTDEDGYTILNIGRTSESLTLAGLKNKYNVVPTNVVNSSGDVKYYYYNSKTGTYVGSDFGNTKIDLANYYTYSQYIYYTVSYQSPNDRVYQPSRVQIGTQYGRPIYEYTEVEPFTDQAFTAGVDSGTKYERIRDYTFEFFYQPAPVDGVVQEAIPLGTTKLRVTGFLYQNDNWGANVNYNDYWNLDNYVAANGLSRMPNFVYSMVYYGQENFAPSFTQNIGGHNYDFGNNNFEESGSLNGNAVISTATGTNNNQQLFNLTYSDLQINAQGIPMINATANRFHGTAEQLETNSDSVVLSEGCAALDLGTSINEYYFYDVVTDQYYRYRNNGNLNTVESSAIPDNAVLLNRYPAYEFGSNSSDEAGRSYLQFLHQYYQENYYYGKTGDDFSLWAGTAGQYDDLSMKKGDSELVGGNWWNQELQTTYTWFTEGVLVFEKGQKYCYIQYTYDMTTDNTIGGQGTGNNEPAETNHKLTRYVGYTYDEDTQTLEYKLTETKMPIYVYVIEGVLDTAAGVNTFVPSELGQAESNTHELDAGQYVLWPQTTLTKNGFNTNNGYDFTGRKVNGLTSATSKDIHAGLTSSADPVYRLIRLSETDADGKAISEAKALNWGNNTGYILGANGTYGLDKKFQMADQGFFGKLNIDPNGNISSVYDSNMMIVPVGSKGVESPIPKGCVAFSVSANSTQTVRIIVSVPTTHLYLGEDGFDLTMDLVNDYYVGLWKIPSIVPGRSVTFNKSDAIEKFELPRSYTFDFEDSPNDIDDIENSSVKHHIDVAYDANGDGEIDEESEMYRTYLNGDTILVAYEFTISGAETGGTYIIGSAHGTDTAAGVPMEIVHFSVSGTASAGLDGVQGNQLGAIDFVYDDARVNANGEDISKIITIGTTSTATDRPGAGGENYNLFDASQSLLYTDLEQKGATTYVKLNQAELYVRRWLKPPATNETAYQTTISYTVRSFADQVKLILFKSYDTTSGDTIVRTEEVVTPTPPAS